MLFHVRRRDREVTDPEELRRILRSTRYVTVALCMDQNPYLVSLSHGYDEKHNCLYFHCASEGKKLVFAKANDRVWGQAVKDYGITDECDYAYTSVHFQGRLSIIDDLTEKQHGMEIMIHQLSTTPEAKLAKINLEKLTTTTMLRIDITGMTGKRHLNPKAIDRPEKS